MATIGLDEIKRGYDLGEDVHLGEDPVRAVLVSTEAEPLQGEKAEEAEDEDERDQREKGTRNEIRRKGLAMAAGEK